MPTRPAPAARWTASRSSTCAPASRRRWARSPPAPRSSRSARPAARRCTAIATRRPTSCSGHTNRGTIYGCHETEVYPDDRLTCASGSAALLFDIKGLFNDNGTPDDFTDDKVNGTPLPCAVRDSSTAIAAVRDRREGDRLRHRRQGRRHDRAGSRYPGVDQARFALRDRHRARRLGVPHGPREHDRGASSPPTARLRTSTSTTSSSSPTRASSSSPPMSAAAASRAAHSARPAPTSRSPTAACTPTR